MYGCTAHTSYPADSYNCICSYLTCLPAVTLNQLLAPARRVRAALDLPAGQATALQVALQIAEALQEVRTYHRVSTVEQQPAMPAIHIYTKSLAVNGGGGGAADVLKRSTSMCATDQRGGKESDVHAL